MMREGTECKEEYRLADGVAIQPFDCGLPGQPVLVKAKDRYYQVSGLAKGLILEASDGMGKSTTVLSEPFAGQMPSNFSPAKTDEIQSALRSLLNLGVIVHADCADSPGVPRKRAARSYFLFKVPLFPKSVVLPISSCLAPIFQPEIMWPAFLFCIVFQFWSWFSLFPRLRMISPHLSTFELSILLVGNYIGLLLHEVGHAAACVSQRAPHGPIGFGVYLLFPAFYTDVTAAWCLPRKKRMIVDAGGMYVSALLSALTTGIYLTTGSLVAAALAGLYSVTVWVSLLPFIRMDGYWLLSDLLGLPSLMQSNREMSRWLLRRLLRRPTTRPAALNLEPTWAKFTYLVYYVLFIIFLGLAVHGLLRWYLPSLSVRIPGHIALLAASWTHRSWPGLIRSLLKLAATLVPLFLWFGFIIRTVRNLLPFVRRQWRSDGTKETE